MAEFATVVVRDRPSGRIVDLVQVSLDEAAVLRVIRDLNSVYGGSAVIDTSQIALARAARTRSEHGRPWQRHELRH